MGDVRIRLLGPLEAEVGGELADLGGPRQRAVVALLLTARGEVVPVDRLIDDLWSGEPPPRAMGALQAYISNLRKALEPRRAPRSPAAVLISAAPGYAIRLSAGEVDGWAVEAELRRTPDDPTAAVSHLEALLARWRGGAFGEFAHEGWAVPEVARFDELRTVVRERLVDARIAVGAAAGAIVEAETLVREAPLREEGWRLLALAQYAAGRQAESLQTLRAARDRLADELGIDPGPRLAALERAVFDQSVDVPAAAHRPAPAPPEPTQPAAEPAQAGGFVGRSGELDALDRAAAAARPGRLTVAVVAGDAGSGKSALLGRFRERLDAAGWTTVVGRCPESEGAPPAWAWSEALRALAAVADPGPLHAELAPLLSDEASATAVAGDAVAGRFRLHQAVRSWLSGLGDRRIAVLLDDAHRADAETRALLQALLDHGVGGRMLVVLAHRPEPRPELDELRAAVARHDPLRLRLEGLDADDCAELIASVTGTDPDASVLAALAERTDGNPFYLIESARLLASEGDVVATSQVPEGVADVLRRRFARLPEETVSVLRLASAVGRDVDVDVLVRAAELDEDAVLDALESGIISGLLVEPDAEHVRFSHLLVQQTLYAGVSRLRRLRWHARLADVIAAVRPHDLSGLAYHSVHAATPASARLAAERAVAAADAADARYAYDAAAALYRQALDCLALADGDTLPQRVAVTAALIGTLLRAGATHEAADVRRRAVAEVAAVDDDHLLVEVITAWRVPTSWVTRPYGYVDAEFVAIIERLLGTADLTAEQRCLLLHAFVRETSFSDDPRTEAAATEMLELARSTGDPGLLGLALTAGAQVYLPDLHPTEREAIRHELGELARAHGLVAYELFAEVMGVAAAGVVLDLEAYSCGVDRVQQIARDYQLGQTIVVGHALAGNRAMLRGDLAEADGRYREAFGTQARIGGVDVRNQYLFAVVIMRYLQGTLPGSIPDLQAASRGPQLIRDLLALAHVQAGDPDQARELLHAAPPPAVDYLWLIVAAIRGTIAAATGETALARLWSEALLPYRDQVAGAGSTGYVFLPVAQVLGRIATVLGRPDEAREHLDRALRIAEHCGNAVWRDAIEADLRAAEGAA